MMKTKALLISSLLLTALVARGDDPPPLPPNPFSNLPPNSEGGFSPFDDDFEGYSDMDQPPPPPPPPPPSGGRPGPGNNAAPPPPPPPPRPNLGGSPSVQQPPVRDSSPGASRLDPANAKDVVENFDYPDAEILDVAKAIAKLTGKNFIYNPQDIKGRISVVSQTPITVGDAWNAFLTALNMRGFALIPSGKYLRIERTANAKEKQTPIYSDKRPPNNDEFITRVIPLRYIDATEFEQAFRLWIPREARMQAYGQTNTIIITDTAAHINRLVELINLLDVAGYQESLVVIPIKNAVAKDIARLIEQILSEGRGGTQPPGFGAPPRPQPAFGAPGANRARTGTGSGRSGGSTISKIIADDRTNALIVKANATGIQEIRSLVRRLDQKVPVAEGSGRIHVIRLQFADAETLAKTLQALTGGGPAAQPRPGAPRAFPVFGEQQPVFQGDIRVSPDKATQSLVVTASPADFATLRKVVETLDVPRDQVFIEALIMEMRLTQNEAFGTSFVSAPNGLAMPSASDALTGILAGNPLAAGGFALGFKTGRPREVSFGTGENARSFTVNSLNGLVELLQNTNDANVVATPKIIALDNEEAIFEISEEIKVPSTTMTAAGIPTTSFTPDRAQTLLKVTPQINKASNFVRLTIEQKLENFDSTNVPQNLRGQTQGKNIRSTNTKVVVQNEDTVVLSGLIRDSVRQVTNKVPILGDIPVLGWLFKNTSTTSQKTNLLVFITPRIIKQYDAMRDALKHNLEERDEFVRENLGSRDPFGRKVDRLRSSLPDLTVIEPLPQQKPLETSSFHLPSPPDRDTPSYYEEEYYDPGYYYPPEGIPLPPIDHAVPGFEMPDNLPPPPAMPQDPGYMEPPAQW
jgi:general secretion pathway protein D